MSLIIKFWFTGMHGTNAGSVVLELLLESVQAIVRLPESVNYLVIIQVRCFGLVTAAESASASPNSIKIQSLITLSEQTNRNEEQLIKTSYLSHVSHSQ